MDLNEIKAKFKNKIRVDITDVDVALKAVPFLIREVENLEFRLAESEKRLAHMAEMFKRRPPLEKKGQKGGASWETSVDEEKNRLNIRLAGTYDYRGAKMASNAIVTVLPNLRENFDVIIDISLVNAELNTKSLFHFRKVMYHLSQSGVVRMIYIVTPQLQAVNDVFISWAKEAGIQNYTAASIEKAEAMLENVGRFLKA